MTRYPWRLPFLFCLTLLLHGACGEGSKPPSEFEAERHKSEPEWFWRDRLSVRPESLPELISPPEVQEALDRAFSGIEGQTPLQAEQAVQDLVRYGERLIPGLEPYLSREDRAVRWAATVLLSRVGGPRATAPLLRTLRDEWDATAVLAACRLGEDGPPWALPRLIKTLGPYPVDFNPHLMVRVQAAGALVRFGNYSGVPFLIKLLKDNTPAQDPEREWDVNPRLAWEKEEALKILSALAGEDFGYHVDASLYRQAESARAFEAWWVSRRAALWKKAPPLEDPLLCRLIRDLVKGLSAYQARNADGSRYCLKMLGPPAFPFLEEAVRSGEFYERFHALDILADLAPLAGGEAERWSEAVSSALADKAPAVRMKAARALGYLGRASALTPLARAMEDPDQDVRFAAVEAMGRISGARSRDLLVSLLEKENPAQLSLEIKAALVRKGPRFDEAFLAELLQGDTRRQEWAVQKLIDLLGEDFDFPVGGSLERRREAVESVRARLAAWDRGGGD